MLRNPAIDSMALPEDMDSDIAFSHVLPKSKLI